ncbi:TraB/GumN family protein [Parasedimentitalea marina]|uniref:TraB/GumN family protein n=1 Tax=Parasedimentitalea marina TaxID=2483033 RepID=UPI001EE8DB21|nr:TraB/GumN family protein [Parasedimentitalea marina]
MRRSLSPEARAQLAQQAAAIPYSQGNHWIASRNGQRIHIIGTQHFGDSRMHSVMRNMRPLIKAADVVFLEQTTVAMEAYSKNGTRKARDYLLPKGTTLPNLMSSEDWAALRMMAPLLDIPADIAPHLQPWVYTMHFGGSRCNVRGFTSRRGLDARIERYAIRNKIPVGGLENPGDGVKAFSRRPLRDQVKYLKFTMRGSAENDDHLITLRESYFDGRLAEGRLLSRQLRFSNQGVSRREAARLINQLDRTLLDGRNKAWMPVILGRKEPVVFIAVGAAHLPGKNGLPALLARRGYDLQRAEF